LLAQRNLLRARLCNGLLVAPRLRLELPHAAAQLAAVRRGLLGALHTRTRRRLRCSNCSAHLCCALIARRLRRRKLPRPRRGVARRRLRELLASRALPLQLARLRRVLLLVARKRRARRLLRRRQPPLDVESSLCSRRERHQQAPASFPLRLRLRVRQLGADTRLLGALGGRVCCGDSLGDVGLEHLDGLQQLRLVCDGCPGALCRECARGLGGLGSAAQASALLNKLFCAGVCLLAQLVESHACC
jgi:hypothetical protein